jgi:hypothetical protein
MSTTANTDSVYNTSIDEKMQQQECTVDHVRKEPGACVLLLYESLRESIPVQEVDRFDDGLQLQSHRFCELAAGSGLHSILKMLTALWIV